MAESPLRLEYEYFPDPTRGRPVSNGAVYVGVPNTDPTVLANRVDVILIQQDGSRVIVQPSSQPFSTSPGGVVEYNGSPAIIRVSDVVSIAVHDSVGAQVYYNPTANQSGSTSGGGSTVLGTGLLNGSFEIDTTPGVPDNWTLAPASNATIGVVTSNQSHGAKSLEFTSNSAAGAGLATSDRFDTSSGGSSDIRFTLRSTSANVLNIVSLRYYDASNNVLTTNVVYSNGTTNSIIFTDVLVTDKAPTGAVSMEVELSGVSSSGATIVGSMWFDNVLIDNSAGTYLVGADGRVLEVFDFANSVNSIQMTSGSAGITPTITQIGTEDIGLLAENILLHNGIITGDLVGDVTGTADNVVTNANLSGDVSSTGNLTTISSNVLTTTHYKKPATGVTNNQLIKNVTPNSTSMILLSDTFLDPAHFVNGVDVNDFRHINIGNVLIPGVITVTFLYRTLVINLAAEVRILVNGVQTYIFSTLSTTFVAIRQDLSVNIGDNITLQGRITNTSTTGRIGSITVTAFEKNFAIA